VHRITALFLACFFAPISMAGPTSGGAQTKGKSALPEECVLAPEDYAVYSAVLLDRGKPEDPEERWDDKTDLIISEVTDSAEEGKSRMWGFRSASKQRPGDDTADHFQFATPDLLPLETAARLSDFLPFPVGGGKRQNLQEKGRRGMERFL
jgi:hypothetical protein